MDCYRIHGKVGEGSFSEVFKASPIASSDILPQYVAIKCLKPERFDAVPWDDEDHRSATTFCKEAVILRTLRPHPNIIDLIDVFIDPRTRRVCIVTELMSMNLFELFQTFRKEPPPEPLVQRLMFQALCALSHLNRRGFFHRDVKPENLLLRDETLKLADFGSCKDIDAPAPFTEYIATRWYRAPECLRTAGLYSYKMDIWSLGCVMYELLTGRPLFPGDNEAEQLRCVHKLIRSDVAGNIRTFRLLLPRYSHDCASLLVTLLTYDPQQRPNAEEALGHAFFATLRYPSPFANSSLVSSATTASPPTPGSHRHGHRPSSSSSLSQRQQQQPEEDAARGSSGSQTTTRAGSSSGGGSPDPDNGGSSSRRKKKTSEVYGSSGKTNNFSCGEGSSSLELLSQRKPGGILFRGLFLRQRH